MRFEVDLGSLEKDLIAGIKNSFYQAFDQASLKARQDAINTAEAKLKSGLSKWQSGFSAKKVSKDVYIIAISGKLATMMEDGIEVGEISKMIMSGNRAKYNAAEGKNYVDVPIPESAMNVSFHTSADSMVKSFKKKDVKMSDFKNGGVRTESRFVNRLKNSVLESKKDMNDSNPAFLTIRRVNEKSVWPRTRFPGAKTFDEAAKNFASNFMNIFESLL